eukprot:TRINITY_DN9108_c0_g1_i1.p1 TRINITY_DN9108_c0_g1~~TRINITY_DN9108_c0_g1_i1.p1  ORF type:complete len:719 (+),score=139.72 TRINITY_DN9108_c0_g1_i1:175-2157(+)
MALGGKSSFGVAATRGGDWQWATGRGFGFYSLAQGLDFATFRLHNRSGLNLQLPFGAGYVGNYSGGSPTRRHFYLVTRSSNEMHNLTAQLRLKTQVPLDKLLNEYILDNVTCSFANFLSDDATNPTHTLRSIAKGIVAALAQGKLPELDLCTISAMLDPDWYGMYRGGMSPENNNFATDFMRVPMLKLLAGYGTKYESLFKQLVKELAQMDLYYSVNDKSGAGAESPGYTEHALESWMTDAPYYAKYYGYDTRKESRYQAGVHFLYKTSQPFAYHFLGSNASRPDKLFGRYILPLGDTHPSVSLYNDVLPKSGIAPDAPFSKWPSEELAGFGTIMRDQPGSKAESFLSFKASPSRGHNHGDALSFHYCAYNARHAVDLMFGYNPRPLQESWHNRLSFGVNENMDGYERLELFKTSTLADVSVGSVTSPRLRKVPANPPGIWNAAYPYRNVSVLYRRALILVKAADEGLAYVVAVDQFNASDPILATYNLFFNQQDAEVAHRVNKTIHDMGNTTVACHLVAGSTNISTVRFANYSEGHENATGLRYTSSSPLAAGIFLSVLYPAGSLTSNEPPPITLNDTSLQVGKDVITVDKQLNIALIRNRATMSLLKPSEIDHRKPQGDIGLTVTDAGYDFGPIPDWVLSQRGIDVTYTWPLNPMFRD